MSGKDALTTPERALLTSYEVVIEQGLQSFVEVGSALMRIRDERLYREAFGTFEAYCQERWNLSRFYVHRLIEASEVVEMLPIGNRPTNESQARELAKLDDPAEQQAAWQEVCEEAEVNGVQVTAAKVREVVNRRQERPCVEHVEPKAFDHDKRGVFLLDWLREELRKWPDEVRHEALHWVRQVVKEFE